MDRQKEQILAEIDKRLDRKLKDTEDGIIKSVADVIGNGSMFFVKKLISFDR